MVTVFIDNSEYIQNYVQQNMKTYLANCFAVQCIEINIMDPLRQFVRL